MYKDANNNFKAMHLNSEPPSITEPSVSSESSSADHNNPQESQQASQRSEWANLDEDRNNIRGDAHEATSPASDKNLPSLASPLLEQQISWISGLPAWLQKEILNSGPVKSIIDSIKQTAAVCDIKSIGDDFTKLFSYADKHSESAAEADHARDIACAAANHTDLIDASMILDSSYLPLNAMNIDVLDYSAPVFEGVAIFNPLVDYI